MIMFAFISMWFWLIFFGTIWLLILGGEYNKGKRK